MINLQPRGRQREVLYLPPQGHFVVLGPAGSGKSTMAILRAGYLGDPSVDHCGQVLLMTFGRALTNYLARMAAERPNVQTLTFHEVAKALLVNAGHKALYDADRMRAMQAYAIQEFRRRHPNHRLAARPDRFFVDEFEWIAGHGHNSLDAYVEAERVGRAPARLLRVDRDPLYDVYQRYLTARRGAGFDFDLQDAAHQLRKALEAGDTTGAYHHVIIDEAQDLSPEVLRASARIVGEEGSLTVFADYAQQIYGHRLSWRSAGLKVTKVWPLDVNYRNTKQVAAFASAIRSHPAFDTSETTDAPLATREGPRPLLTRFATRAAEEGWIVRTVQQMAQHNSVAVLARTTARRNRLGSILPPASTRLDRTLQRIEVNAIYYGTLHSAKGLEFDHVVIAGCSDQDLPDPKSVSDLGPEDALVDDLRLLYVGATRAKQTLALTCVGRPTPLLAHATRFLEEQVST